MDGSSIWRSRRWNHYEKSVWNNTRLRFMAASPIIYIVMCISLGESWFIFEGELSHEFQQERKAANSKVLTICVSHFFEVLVESPRLPWVADWSSMMTTLFFDGPQAFYYLLLKYVDEFHESKMPPIRIILWGNKHCKFLWCINRWKSNKCAFLSIIEQDRVAWPKNNVHVLKLERYCYAFLLKQNHFKLAHLCLHFNHAIPNVYFCLVQPRQKARITCLSEVRYML